MCSPSRKKRDAFSKSASVEMPGGQESAVHSEGRRETEPSGTGRPGDSRNTKQAWDPTPSLQSLPSPPSSRSSPSRPLRTLSAYHRGHTQIKSIHGYGSRVTGFS